MRLKTLLMTASVLGLLLSATAAAYTPRHGKPCHHGYSTRFKRVRVTRNGHKSWQRVRVCVKRAKRAVSPSPSPSRVTKLHAHLDPSYTRDPLDPFKVTYAFSASATRGEANAASIATEEPAPLPSGVLALYSDGKLECAINVGASTTGSECPVRYQALGDHTVTTIYTSGESSATETEVERIEPLATTTTLSVSYEPFSGNPTSSFGCGEGSACHIEAGWEENGGFEIGTVTVHGSVEPWSSSPLMSCQPEDGGCLDPHLDGSGTATFPVEVMANFVALEDKDLALGETLVIEPEATKAVSIKGLRSQVPIADIENAAYHFAARSPAVGGYLPSSDTVALTFSPTLGSQVERVP